MKIRKISVNGGNGFRLLLLLIFIHLVSPSIAQNTVLIPAQSQWAYLDNGSNPGTSWTSVGFDDSAWKTGNGKFGYGEGNEVTVLSYGPDAANKYISYLFRASFNVENPAGFNSLVVKLLRDDGAVVYINGTEVVRSNMPATSNFSTLAIEGVGGEDELTYFPFTVKADMLVPGKNVVAVEIHQQAVGSSDLSFDLELEGSARLVVPLRINEIMASNSSASVDPDYNQFGDWIELYNGSSEPFDLTGFSLSDNLDNPGKWKFPSGSKVPASGYLVIYADGVNTNLHTNFQLSRLGESIGLFNSSGGVIDTLSYPVLSTNLSYGCMTDGSVERGYFWLATPGSANKDGNLKSAALPDPVFSQKAGFFTGPVTLVLTCTDPEAVIRYTRDGSDPVPNSSRYTAPLTISSNSVVKARAFKDGILPSNVITNTYFVNENIDIAVISISLDPAFLDDPDLGIYLNDRLDERKEWERPATLEFFEPDGSRGFYKNVDLRLFGRSAVRFPEKSFGVFIRPTEGVDGLDYNLFPGTPYTHYQSFVLRSSSDDWRNTMFRDGMCQTLFQDIVDVVYQDYRPSIVFINGVFMGIHNIRDKINPNHFLTHKGVDPANLDLIYVDNDYNPPVIEAKSGDEGAFWVMWNYITKNDMTSAANYATASTMMDMDNYIDFNCIQILAANQSWRHNLKLWREKSGDGKFRCVVWDLDYGYQFIDRNNLSEITANEPMMKALVKNAEFKAKLKARLDYLSQTAFTTERSLHTIDSMAATIEPYIQRHANKWSGTLSGVFASASEWQQRVEVMRSFARARPDRHDGYFKSYFGVSTKKDFNVSVSPAGAGTVYMNGNLLTASEFSGNFYTGSTYKITAVPNDGYTFSGWQGFGTSSKTAIAQRSTWNYLDDGSDQGNTWYAPDLDDSSWKIGTAPFGYGESSGITTTVSYGPNSGNRYLTTYFRKEFTVTGADLFETLSVQLIRDDGAVVYLNGTEIARSNMPAGEVTYMTRAVENLGGANETAVQTFTVDPALLKEGVNLIAVELHQVDPSNTDLRFDLSLTGTVNNIDTKTTTTITLNNNLDLVALFQTKKENPIVISEINYAPSAIIGEDAEYIEIQNTSGVRRSLSGFHFQGVEFTFPSNAFINPGAAVIVTRNLNLYSYLDNVYQWQSGDLSDSGEEIILLNSTNSIVDKVAYGVAAPWPEGVAGTGYSIELSDTGSDNNLGANWKKSAYSGGSPGAVNPESIYKNLKINEISAIPIGSGLLGAYNWFEVVNTGSKPVNLAGYYLSNDPNNPIKYKIPGGYDSLTVIHPNEYKVFFAENTPEIGPLHVPFKLKGEGGSLVLTALAGDRMITVDRADYGISGKGTTLGRLPNGTGAVVTLNSPSPRRANRQVDNSIIVASRIKSGDYVPVVVKIRNSGGEIDKTVNGNFRLEVSSGTVEPDTIRVRNGMGSAICRFTSANDFELSIKGYGYKRYVEVSANIPTVTLNGPINAPTTLAQNVDYLVRSNLIIGKTGNLIIPEGTRLIFDNLKTIVSDGRLQFKGTLENPIVIMPSSSATWWGGIEIHNVDSLSEFEWVMMGKGGGDKNKWKGHSYEQPLIFGDHANISLNYVFMTDNKGKAGYCDYSNWIVRNSYFARCDMGPEIRFSHGEYYDSWFMEMPDNDWTVKDDDNDCIYFWEYSDFTKPHIVDNCVLNKTEDDGIDMLVAPLIVKNSLFSNLYEKGISAGYRSQVSVDRSVFAFSPGGVQSSFESYVNITNSTFFRTGKPVYSYTASGDLTNCILSKTNTAYSNDSLPSFYFDHCISDSDPNLLGVANLYGNPGLKDPDKWDFTLSSTSGSIDKGNAKTGLDPDGTLPDLGAFWYGKGVSETLKFNEIYYHPSDLQGAEQNFEFIEIINISSKQIDLSGIRITGGVDFIFSEGSFAKPGEIILIASNRFSYASLPGQVYSWKPGLLSNNSATLKLVTSSGNLLDEVTYTDASPWPALADGEGNSLSLSDPFKDNSLAANWEASYVFGGTPGLPNSAPDFSKIKVNEYFIQTLTSDLEETDKKDQWIEVYNSSLVPVNIGGLYWSDDVDNLLKWKIPLTSPSKTNVPAGGCVLFKFTATPDQDPLNIGFSVSQATKKIYLSLKNGTQNQIIDQIIPQSIHYPASKGRYPNGTGSFRSFSYSSPAVPNTVPAKHMIAPRVMMTGERLPVVIIVDTLNGVNPKTVTGNITLGVTNGTLRSTSVSMVKGYGSMTTKIENATGRLNLSLNQYNDTLGVEISSGRHLVTMDNEQRFGGVWTSEHDYWVRNSIIIPVGRKLVIMPGTRILMGDQARIVIDGTLEVRGTPDNPVIFTSQTWANPWGGLIFGQYAEPSTLSYAFFINGGADPARATGHSASQAVITTTGGQVDMDHCFFIDNIGKAVYAESALVRMNGCLISRCDAGVEIYNGRLEMDKSCAIYLPNETLIPADTKEHDAIYLSGRSSNYSESAYISNSLLGLTSDDAVDLYQNSGLAVNTTYFYKTADKALSLAQNKVTGNYLVFEACDEAVAAREAGFAYIDHSTFYKNSVALRSYSTAPDLGHGHVIVSNSIFSESISTDASKDPDNEITITYSMTDKSLPAGTGNKVASARFANAMTGDFQLTASSPAIDAGDPDSPLDPDGTRTDMGAYWYNHGSSGKIMIHEIFYNPGETTSGKFIELVNASQEATDLNGFRLEDAVSLTISQTLVLQPGEFLVICERMSDYQDKGYKVLQWNSGGLSSAGGTVSLYDSKGFLADQVTFASSGDWPAWPLLYHSSIELIETKLNNSLPEAWRTSYYVGGTPGRVNQTAPVEKVYINEVLARNTRSYPDETGQFSDWVEIYNQSVHFVDVGGLYLTKTKTTPGSFEIPGSDFNSTLIPPGGHLVFWLDEQPTKGVRHVSFVLPGAGSFVGLSKSNSGNFVWLDSLSYPAIGSDVSFGRVPDGGVSLIRFDNPTPGLPNKAPRGKLSGLYLNELMARNTSTIRNNLGEFDDWIEIYNSTSEAVDVGGLYLTDHKDNLNLWKIPETRPDSTTIPAKGFMLFYPTLKTTAGVRHTDFQLAGGGEFIGLTQMVNEQMIILDSVTYPILTNDISYGRTKDGTLPWIKFTATTPGFSNSGTSGIDEHAGFDQINIYPSPATDHLWIEIPNGGNDVLEVRIIDITGKPLKTWDPEDLSGNGRITLYWSFGNDREPVSGVYLLAIKSKSGYRVSKFFISR